MEKKYRISLKGDTGSKTPAYILGLRMHIKGYFGGTYSQAELEHILHCVASYIDSFSFRVRNTVYTGSILKRRIHDESMDIYNLGDGKMLLGVSFEAVEEEACNNRKKHWTYDEKKGRIPPGIQGAVKKRTERTPSGEYGGHIVLSQVRPCGAYRESAKLPAGKKGTDETQGNQGQGERPQIWGLCQV